jgi:hypothetical protein
MSLARFAQDAPHTAADDAVQHEVRAAGLAVGFHS